MEMVTVILLNWNGLKYIDKCVESVFEQDYENIEFIVVDNGSTDLSLEVIEKKYSNLIIIKNEVNLGFAQGMNSGISVASGNYILFLNLDVYLRSDYISKAIDLFKTDKHLGCVGGIEYKWTDSGFVDEHLPSSGPYFLKKRVQLYSDSNLVNKSCYAFGVTGSFPVFRRAAIDDLITISGYFFDPLFQTGWEDTDVRFRLFWRGWKTFYSTNLVGWHVGSGSADSKKKLIEKPLNYQQRIFRNRMYVVGKFPSKLRKKLGMSIFVTNLLLIPYYLFRSPRSLKALYLALKEVKKNRLQIAFQQKLIETTAIVEVNEILKYFQKY